MLRCMRIWNWEVARFYDEVTNGLLPVELFALDIYRMMHWEFFVADVPLSNKQKSNLRKETRIIRWVPRVLREVVVWRVRMWRRMGWRVDRLLGFHVPAGASCWLLARHIWAGSWAGSWGTVLHVAGRWWPARGTASWNIRKRVLKLYNCSITCYHINTTKCKYSHVFCFYKQTASP